jgi:hypothetical protein
MSARRGSAHYAGLLPVELSDEPPCIRATSLEIDWFQNAQPSLCKRALHALSFLIALCSGVAAAFAWWSYGDAARLMIESSYQQLSWLAPRQAAVQKTPDTVAASAVSYPDQLDAMLRDLHAMRQSLDRIVAGQELITRSTRSIDEIATSIAAGQAPMTRGTNQTAATITTGQAPMTRNTDQTTTSIDQAPSANANSIPVESRDAASLQSTVRLNKKPTESKSPQTSSERGKQLSAASGHDASCFLSASAVLENRPGGSPTWTMRAPGHEGTLCWHAAARPSGSDHRASAGDHRRETMPTDREIVGTTENTLFPPPTPYRGAPE